MHSVLEDVEEFKKQQEEQKEVEVPAPVEEEKAPANLTVREGLEKAVGKAIQESDDIKKMTRDLTYLAGANNLQNDEKFTSKYQKEQGEQLINDLKSEGQRQAIVDAAKKQEAKNLRAQAYYDGCKPIFELLDIDKAYGLVPMVITTLLMMIPFLVVSLIRFVVNSVNSVATAIAGFKKPAFWMCTIILCLLVTAVAVLASMYGIDKVFGTHIILR